MTNTLVSYYSLTNNTHKIAELIVQAVNADTERILDALKREGIFGYLRSGRQALFQHQGAIQSVKKDPAQYDLIVLGAPVWSWNLTPPMRSYVIEQQHKFKRVAFFCTEGGAGGARLFEQLQTLCGKQPVATLEITEGELKSGEYSHKVQTFIQQIKTGSEPAIAESEKRHTEVYLD